MSKSIFSDEEKDEIRQEIVERTINNIFSDSDDAENFKEQIIDKIVEKTVNNLGMEHYETREEFKMEIAIKIANKTFKSVIDGNEHTLFNSIGNRIAEKLFEDFYNGESFQDPSKVVQTFANQITRNFIDKLQKK